MRVRVYINIFSAQGAHFRGGKKQAAIPTPAMQVLKGAPFLVTGECFASPLKCYYGGFGGNQVAATGAN
jgi:hypothetical protein